MSKTMAEIDFAMLTTRTDSGQLATRPMSNNGEVEYDGDSFYFSWDSARIVSDIGRDPHVALSFKGSAGLLGKPPLLGFPRALTGGHGEDPRPCRPHPPLGQQ